MGLTLSDVHQIMYARWRAKGLSYDEAIQNVPKIMRDQFLKDIQMSSIESHFGMKDKWFFLTLITVIVGAIVLGIVLS